MEAFDTKTLAAGCLGGGEKAIRLTAQQIDKAGRTWLRFTVEDNGPGMPATIRERVFDPFFITKDRTKHSGLGLWISRSIAQEHGGDLTRECPSTELPPSPGSSGEASRAGPSTERRAGAGGHGARFHMDIPVGQGRAPFGVSKRDCHAQDTDR